VAGSVGKVSFLVGSAGYISFLAGSVTLLLSAGGLVGSVTTGSSGLGAIGTSMVFNSSYESFPSASVSALVKTLSSSASVIAYP
jgi:hypothetical protein